MIIEIQLNNATFFRKANPKNTGHPLTFNWRIREMNDVKGEAKMIGLLVEKDNFVS